MKLKNEILKIGKILKKLKNLYGSFDYLQIKIASAEKIKSWAERILPNGVLIGEVFSRETVNFRTNQPEPNGLFCEKIFGPIKDWKCKCGIYNGFVADTICEICNVEIIQSRVRRYRMGFVELTCPMSHLWYLKGTPSYLTIILDLILPDIKTSQIERIIYYREESTPEEFLKYSRSGNVTSKSNEFKGFYSSLFSSTGTTSRQGAELIKFILEDINNNLKEKIEEIRSLVTNLNSKMLKKTSDFQKIKLLFRKIRILESFLATETNLASMIFTVLAVLPPTLRPLVELDKGRMVSSDLTIIYQRILDSNKRLFSLVNTWSIDLFLTHEKKLLQECVDALIDNARVPKERKKLDLNNKALKGLTESLEGKQGRFRQSLLGKRVDYSARSVIVVGPTLRLNQCGLPYQITLELFRPFLIHELLKIKTKTPSYNTKLATAILKTRKPLVWTLLVKLTKKYSVLLNRAPTLHRFGIQAFDPILVLGQAIHLHPLVCTGFNADFDGDQMAVHLPLYEVSQLEIRTMMRPCFNVLSPSNGEVILKPTQDMVIGCYYLTLMIYQNKSTFQKWFTNEQEALLAFYQKKLTIHTPILVRYKIFNLNFIIENKKLKCNKQEKNVLFQPRDIEIHQIFSIFSLIPKCYLITNIGIFIAYQTKFSYQNKNASYSLTDLFLETTPGRLIFNQNVKQLLFS